METGKITIIGKTTDNMTVHMELAGGTVWMTKHEIADLFDVFVSAVAVNLKSLFKSGDLREWEVMTTHRYTDSRERVCQIEYYNLEAILALCFRLKGQVPVLFRRWVLGQIGKPVIASPHIPIFIQFGNTILI